MATLTAGNPVIAKANSSHPGTTRLLDEEAFAAVGEAGLPPATVQLIYRTSHKDGERLVSDPRTGATGHTGSRSAGLKLKAAADAAGKPIYLELSAVNPVVMLPGALAERGPALVDEFVVSSLMGTGQFCTNPSLVLLVAGEATEQFVAGVKARFDTAAPTPLLSSAVARALTASVATLEAAGAHLAHLDAALVSPARGAFHRQDDPGLPAGHRHLADHTVSMGWAERLNRAWFHARGEPWRRRRSQSREYIRLG